MAVWRLYLLAIFTFIFDMVPAVYTVNQIFCNGGRLGIQKV